MQGFIIIHIMVYKICRKTDFTTYLFVFVCMCMYLFITNKGEIMFVCLAIFIAFAGSWLTFVNAAF